MTSQNRPAPRPFRALALAFALGAATCLLGFAFGRWSAPAPAPAASVVDETAAIRAEVARAVAEAMARQAPLVQVAAASRALSPGPVIAAAVPPSAPAPQSPSPEVVARAHKDAHAKIEELREYITSRCWPSGGLAKGRTSTRVVFNLTFDASGREIARGVSEDRRAPAGEFGACLRRLSATELSIPPPGTTVAFSVPVDYP